jgi:hypothetical protein
MKFMKNNKIIITLIILILFLSQTYIVLGQISNNEGNWTRYLHDDYHSGFQSTAGNGNLSKYGILWYKQFSDSISNLIYGEAAVADIDLDGEKEIIVGTDSSMLYCLNIDGEMIWQFNAEGRISCTPTLVNLNNDDALEIIITSGSGKIYTISAEGNLLWEYETERTIDASAAVGDITQDGNLDIVVGSYDGNLYALTKEGELIWKFDAGESIVSTAVIIDIDDDKRNEIIVGDGNGIMYAITTNNVFENIGLINRTKYIPEVVWQFETSIPNNVGFIGSPVIYDIDNDGKQELIFCSEDGSLFCLDLSGNVLWQYKTDGPTYNTPAIADINNNGIIDIVFNSGNKIIAIDINRNLLWQHEFSMRISPDPILFDINGDGYLEIATIDQEMVTLTEGVHAECWINNTNILDYNGNIIHKLKFHKEMYNFPYGISVVDFDDDGKLEILTGCRYECLYCYGELDSIPNENNSNNEENGNENNDNNNDKNNPIPSFESVSVILTLLGWIIFLFRLNQIGSSNKRLKINNILKTIKKKKP